MNKLREYKKQRIEERLAALAPDRYAPLRELDPELWGEIAKLEVRHRKTCEFPQEPPDWGDNQYWEVPYAVLDEALHFAHMDLLDVCHSPPPHSSSGVLIKAAKTYRQWLVTIVGCFGDFGRELRQHKAKYEFFDTLAESDP